MRSVNMSRHPILLYPIILREPKSLDERLVGIATGWTTEVLEFESR
jgi:hypothetical protein